MAHSRSPQILDSITRPLLIRDQTMCLAKSPTPGILGLSLETPAQEEIDRLVDRFQGLGDQTIDFVGELGTLAYLLSSPDERRNCRGYIPLQSLYGLVVVQVAQSKLQVREDRDKDDKTHNTGDDVEEFQQVAGGAAGNAWCAAFAFYCHTTAAALLYGITTCPRTMSAAQMWYKSRKADNERYFRSDVESGSPEPLPGDLFVFEQVLSKKDGVVKLGNNLRSDSDKFFPSHTGIVKRFAKGQKGSLLMVTIEGNTSSGAVGSREGDGVFERTDRLAVGKGGAPKYPQLQGFVRPRIILT